MQDCSLHVHVCEFGWFFLTPSAFVVDSGQVSSQEQICERCHCLDWFDAHILSEPLGQKVVETLGSLLVPRSLYVSDHLLRFECNLYSAVNL
jgi:hypothetical protein